MRTIPKSFGADIRETFRRIIEEFKYPKLGPGELWEAAAGEFTERGGKILKNVSVKRINASGNRVLSVIADTENGEKEFTGDIFFSSMPVKDLKSPKR